MCAALSARRILPGVQPAVAVWGIALHSGLLMHVQTAVMTRDGAWHTVSRPTNQQKACTLQVPAWCCQQQQHQALHGLKEKE